MKKEEPKTDFNFSYAALEQLGDKADDLMIRDSAELATYGVDPVYIANVAAKTLALKNYATDEELKAAAAIATEQKEAAADVLRVGIRGMMVRVKQVFKPSSATYKGFGTKELDEITENDLVRCGHRVGRLAMQYLPQLAPKGVTPILITELDSATTILDEAIDTQDTANRMRNLATHERVEMANALYAIIVELFDFGKDYWYTRNEAKYNDYIIYNTPGGGATPPDSNPISYTLEGTVAVSTIATVVDNLNATAVVQVTNTGFAAFVVCTTANSADVCSSGTTVQPNTTATLGADSDESSSNLGEYLKIANNDLVNEAAYSVTVTG